MSVLGRFERGRAPCVCFSAAAKRMVKLRIVTKQLFMPPQAKVWLEKPDEHDGSVSFLNGRKRKKVERGRQFMRVSAGDLFLLKAQ